MYIEVKNSEKLVDYSDSMDILEKRVNEVYLNKANELLWILEHKTVYTAGTSSIINDVVDKNIKIIKTNRGGKHTVHSPGQKIVYFVINLNHRKKDIKNLINNVENCIINILDEFNIKSFKDKKNIGIWIKKNNNVMKIASIGIKVKKWIAYHGFSINVSNDLSLYNKIIPCGIKDIQVTSFKNLGVNNFKNIDKVIENNFLNTFR